MPLKASYAKKEEIPKGQESLYVEKDGTWVLEVEGMVSSSEFAGVKSRLDEFRTNNINLSASLKELEGKKFLTQEEQDEFDRLKEESDNIRDKKLIDAGKIDELLAQRTERMRTDYDNQIAGYKKQVEDLTTLSATHEGRLSKVLVESSLASVLSKSGIQPVQGALEDLVSRARVVWKANEKGDLVALDPAGNPIYGTEASTPITLDEWTAGVVKDAPYLFMDNKGAGGEGGKGGGHKGSDGILRIPRSDENLKSLHIEDIATGKAIVVEG